MLATLICGLAIGALALTFSALRPPRATQTDAVANRINALLPQTQCEQCSFPGCAPYAQAIAEGRADINRCPPGGQETVDTLARLLDRDPIALAVPPPGPAPVAFIDEDVCIGCVKCIQACPVDAILGASKRMHTVIESECTGCELCIAPCPVDCISLRAPTKTGRAA